MVQTKCMVNITCNEMLIEKNVRYLICRKVFLVFVVLMTESNTY